MSAKREPILRSKDVISVVERFNRSMGRSMDGLGCIPLWQDVFEQMGRTNELFTILFSLMTVDNILDYLDGDRLL